MAFTHTVATNWSGGGISIPRSNQYSGSGEVNITETVADSITDKEVALVLDVSEIKSIYIVSDQDLTLETNNAGAPVDTIALLAGVPYIWNTDSYPSASEPPELNADITALFLTNASGSTATFELRCIVDVTP